MKAEAWAIGVGDVSQSDPRPFDTFAEYKQHMETLAGRQFDEAEESLLRNHFEALKAGHGLD
jgi:hypothetical protein